MTSDEPGPPIVFISYSHDSQEHADRVLALSDHLRADGFKLVRSEPLDCCLRSDGHEDGRVDDAVGRVHPPAAGGAVAGQEVE